MCALVEEDAFHSLSGWQACSHLTAEHTVGVVETDLKVRGSVSNGPHSCELYTHKHKYIVVSLKKFKNSSVIQDITQPVHKFIHNQYTNTCI